MDPWPGRSTNRRKLGACATTIEPVLWRPGAVPTEAEPWSPEALCSMIEKPAQAKIINS